MKRLVRRRDELDARVQVWVGAFDAAEVLARLDAAAVPCSRVKVRSVVAPYKGPLEMAPRDEAELRLRARPDGLREPLHLLQHLRHRVGREHQR